MASVLVNFASVLTMEHSVMVKMFKSLEDLGLKGFLEASGSVYEEAVLEFFANAKVLAGTIVSLVGARNIAITKDTLIEFSGSDEPFKAPNKKKEMKIEFRLLHDIVAKALCAKAGSFDQVTSEKLDIMIAITAGMKFNWAQILFQVLPNMVKTPKRQWQGFAIQVSALLLHLVKENLGESVKMHPQKVLTSKSVQTYIKRNSEIKPTGESSKQNEDTASNAEGGESQGFQPINKVKPVNRKKKSTTAEPRQKKQKVSTQTVEARSQVAPTNFDSEESSETDSCPLVARRCKRKQRSAGDGGNSQYGSIPTIPTEGKETFDKENQDNGSEENEKAIRDQDAQMSNDSQFENQGCETELDSMNPNDKESDSIQDEPERSSANSLETKTNNSEKAIVAHSGPGRQLRADRPAYDLTATTQPRNTAYDLSLRLKLTENNLRLKQWKTVNETQFTPSVGPKHGWDTKHNPRPTSSPSSSTSTALSPCSKLKYHPAKPRLSLKPSILSYDLNSRQPRHYKLRNYITLTSIHSLKSSRSKAYEK
ncbi:hypothetical protein F511_26459 [Dorcoceras hygrometricum]|uniref:Uncharacterized protein n=1 Tax=Dorcoceras hygrometricum TaxID=472368 RepID=A0A2Z7CBF5_9LAMI|nr:hypothetical protein F511_26459 [Dorcoceras hygrometricum]